MIKIVPKFLLLSTVMLAACGKLEWPPKSGGAGYSGNEIGLVYATKQIHKPSLTSSPKLKPKGFLNPPIIASSKEHIVAYGETLWRIAQAYNTDIYELAILNQIEPPFRIFVGQSLI